MPFLQNCHQISASLLLLLPFQFVRMVILAIPELLNYLCTAILMYLICEVDVFFYMKIVFPNLVATNNVALLIAKNNHMSFLIIIAIAKRHTQFLIRNW